jgi:hypothetical protein
LEAWLGIWEGEYQRRHMPWLRMYDREGNLVPTPAEAAQQQAEMARLQAEAERQRAEETEAKLQRLLAQLRERGIELDL